MSATATPDRKSVRKFFEFFVNNDELKPRPFSWRFVIGGVATGFIIGSFSLHSQLAAFFLAIVGGGGVLALDLYLRKQDVEKRREKKEENHKEFAKLAGEVRLVQAADVTKALLRVFERTQIDRSTLRILDGTYVLSKERELFSDESLQERLGDLLNKSFRFLSMGDYTNKRFRKIRWTDEKREELFFNPTRLVALFLAENQVIICNVQIDSMDGDLREEIERVAVSKVVNIKFQSDRKRFTMKNDALVKMAEDLGYSVEEIAEIKTSLNSSDKTSPEWVQEEMTSTLTISRTDGGHLSMPIRSEITFGKHKSALDSDSTLNADELTVDRMINELNRLVHAT